MTNEINNAGEGCVEMISSSTNSKNSNNSTSSSSSSTSDPLAALPLLHESTNAYYDSEASINIVDDYNNDDDKKKSSSPTTTAELISESIAKSNLETSCQFADDDDDNRPIRKSSSSSSTSSMKLHLPIIRSAAVASSPQFNQSQNQRIDNNNKSPEMKKDLLIFNFNRKKEPPITAATITTDSVRTEGQQQQQDMKTMAKTMLIRDDNSGSSNNKINKNKFHGFQSSTSKIMPRNHHHDNHLRKNINTGNGTVVGSGGTQIKSTTITTKPSNIPTYRYAGHFTEKFYRSQSQPSLLLQMDQIGNKLKMKRNDSPITTILDTTANNIGSTKLSSSSSIPTATLATKSSSRSSSKSQMDLLPFVDGSPPKNDDGPTTKCTPKTNFNNNRTTTTINNNTNNHLVEPINSNTIKPLTQAPFARIDDV